MGGYDPLPSLGLTGPAGDPFAGFPAMTPVDNTMPPPPDDPNAEARRANPDLWALPPLNTVPQQPVPPDGMIKEPTPLTNAEIEA